MIAGLRFAAAAHFSRVVSAANISHDCWAPGQASSAEFRCAARRSAPRSAPTRRRRRSFGPISTPTCMADDDTAFPRAISGDARRAAPARRMLAAGATGRQAMTHTKWDAPVRHDVARGRFQAQLLPTRRRESARRRASFSALPASPRASRH